MKVLNRFGLMVAVAVLASLAGVARAQTLDGVLKQMDASSPKFQSALADFHKDLYERVVKETSTQAGTIYYQRVGGSVQMGVKFTSPDKFVEVKNGILQMYDPGPNHLTVISLKSNKALADSYLTLGFGGSGKDLAAKWQITFMGMEPLNDGKKMVPTAKLDLVPKDANTRNTFTHILIWIDPVQDISLKQQFFQPSGDNQTATYTNIRYNSLKKSDLDAFAIRPKAKFTVENH